MKVSDSLRRAIEDSGESRYAISQDTGVNQGTLSRFVVNGGQLRTDTLDRLCEHLGLELRAKARKRKGR